MDFLLQVLWPERSSFVNNSLSLSGVGSGLLTFSSEFTFVFLSTLPLVCSQFMYSSSVSSVLGSGANMGGTTLAVETQVTLVPFFRTTFPLCHSGSLLLTYFFPV